MKKFFTLKFVLVCISLCISLNARTQTDVYQNYLSNEGVFVKTDAPSPSQGEVRFPAEFEPVQAVMVVYPLNVPYQLLQEISKDCKLVTVVNTRKNSSTADGARQDYINNGVNINNCEFIEAGINSHWIRDFGPWCVFHGKDVAIVDNIYNCSFYNEQHEVLESPNWSSGNGRLYDDQFARTYATNNNIPLYGMEVIHTGGNMMQDGRGVGVSDDIVYKESKTFVNLSEETVNQRMKDYLGINPYHVTIDPQGDYIAHVDCWGKFLAPDKIIIAKVPSTHEQYDEYEEVANYFATTDCCWGYPYKVYRVEVPVTNKSEIKAYNKIAPYTNSLILNNKVLVPISSLTPSSYNDAALAVYREAMPGYEIIGIDYVLSDDYGPYESGWKNTDALHCRTRDIMDFKMLFVDHRNVLFGEQAYKESYPITAKFIAYSGDDITETKLYYSINDGEYTSVNMTATGNADEYVANITGHADGATIKYYVTGEDASGRTCVQPQFGELEPHTFTAGAASTQEPEQPAQPTLDLTKYYRIKTTIGTNDQYLTIFDHTSNVLGQYGGVGVASLDESKVGQMFKFENVENAEEGKYYLKSADGYYIYCQSYNVDAIDGTQKSALWGFDYESNFELQCDKGYFKVETVNGGNYVFCNATKETRATTIATWSLEEVPVSVTISADNNSVTVNESVQLNATATGGTGNYTYSWSPATSFADATIANPTFTSATTGTFDISCTVTDNETTVTSNTVTITVNEAQQGGTSSEVVTIGDINNSVGFRNAPTNTYNSRSVTQQYYLSDSIKKKDGGTISAIAFHTADGDFSANTDRNFTIYMKNTSTSAFDDKYMVKMDASEIVFAGTVSLTPNQWITINLTNSFEYTGENILLCVHDNSGNFNNGINFKGFSTGTSERCKYNHNGDNSTSPADKQYTGTTSFTIPLIQFTFGAAQVDPITISADPSKVTVGEKVNFTVMQGSSNVTANAKFYIGEEEISNPYTTTSAGTFTVRAEKDGLTSETKFTVVEPNPINLYVNPSEVLVGKNIKFTVTQVDINGTEQDVTNDSRFYIEETNKEVLSTYTTETAGTFTVRAEKDGLTATKTFTVVNPIILTATPSTVTVGEEIKFTVMQGNDNVTNSATFYIEDETINNPYTTTATGTFTVRAEKDGLTAETTITVNEAQQGEEVVTIDGNDNNTTTVNVPIKTYNSQTLSQQYYHQEEIGKNSGDITCISFCVSESVNTFPFNRNIRIYLTNTENSTFSSVKTIIINDNDLVYEGPVEFVEGWVNIKFNKNKNKFEYTGKNILVTVWDYTGNYLEHTTFKAFATSTNVESVRCLYTTSNVKSPTTNSLSCNRIYNVPHIQFTFASSDTPQEPTKPTISVVDNKTKITADNSDYVKFTVTPADAEIWYTSGTQETQLTTTDKSFKTSNAGTYSFYAKKDGLVSDSITVEAVAEDELTLTLSTNNIVANGIDEVTFTVTQDDINGTEQDVTNNCTFKINGTAITGNTFFTNRAGEYTVTATKGNKSATAAITATAVSGEENVVLIDGNVMQPADQNKNYNEKYLSVPVNNYYNYSISQQYYTKGEIGKDEGVITHIAFKTAKTAGTYTRDIEVYLVNTDESMFSSKDLKQMSENDMVYSGKVQFSSNSWVNIPLSGSGFKYTGKNVLICVNDKTKSFEETLTSHFDTYALNDDRVIYKHDLNELDPTAQNTGNTYVYFVPFVKFTFEEEQPIVLESSKQTITADGSDMIRFTVTQDNKNVTDKTEIYVEQYEDTKTLNLTILNATTGYAFTTENAGYYRAYAKKDDLRSNNVDFTAVYPIILTADKTNIIANGSDAITFTLMQNDIDITTADGTIIYVGDNIITNTFTTSIEGTYIAYATKDGIISNGIEITVRNENINEDGGIYGGESGLYFYSDGSVTYNKGSNNEYTLITRRVGDIAIIVQDNAISNDAGDFYFEKNSNKPMAKTTLTIPEKVLFGNEWVTVTSIDHAAFDNLFYCNDYMDYNLGNELNDNFGSIIIPSSITEIGTYTFGFNMEQSVDKIICYAATPPTYSKGTTNNPFLKNTYNNIVLYVPKASLEAYQNATGWGQPSPYNGLYFNNIQAIETPTFNGNGSWTNTTNWDTDFGTPEDGDDIIINGNVVIENGTIANVGTINIISGSLTVEEGGQLIHTNAGVTVTMKKEITGFGNERGTTNWYTISSPIFNSVDTSAVENLLSNNYDLYRYDEPTHYWDNIKDLKDSEGPVGNWSTLDAGRGYLYANSSDVTLQFNGVANHTSASYTLTRGTKDGKLEGFHLVGNPFTHNIYMSSAFETNVTLANGYYVLTNEGAWGAKLGTDEPIKPCQGVLIQATEGDGTLGTLTINKKVDPAPQTRSRSNNEFVAISIANNKYEDVAYVSFNAENPLEKVNHQNKNIPMVYIPAEDINYSIATMENDVEEIPVAFEAKTMGQYTIGAKSENCEFKEMYLLDKMTGIKTNLLLESYTFMATTTDNPERFVIKLNKNANDLDNGNFIFINNNEMIINNIEGRASLQIFDVMGRYLCNYEVTGSANISTEEFSSGVYIIRLMDDNGVKTQKVVL